MQERTEDVRCEYTRERDCADYNYIYSATADFTNIVKSKVKSMSIHINIVPLGYEFDHEVEPQLIELVNKAADPFSFVKENIWVLPRLKVHEFSANLSQDEYYRLLGEVYSKWCALISQQ
jgi:hypothetical protein